MTEGSEMKKIKGIENFKAKNVHAHLRECLSVCVCLAAVIIDSFTRGAEIRVARIERTHERWCQRHHACARAITRTLAANFSVNQARYVL